MDVTSSTNARTMISTPLGFTPTSHKVPTLTPLVPNQTQCVLQLGAVTNSFAFDYLTRNRFGGLSLIWAVLAETAVPARANTSMALSPLVARLLMAEDLALPSMLRAQPNASKSKTRKLPALTSHERVRIRAIIEAIIIAAYELDEVTAEWVVTNTDFPRDRLNDKSFTRQLNPKGFWRIDKTKHPEHRLTVLSLIAFHDLKEKIAACGGDVAKGIETFCNQNDGEGWMLPETLRLADYGLGQDDRAREHQPVRECFGPRFYDWQLAQSPEESWRECHLHARNLLGPEGYQALLDELEGKAPPEPAKAKSKKGTRSGQKLLFETEELPLFDEGN